MSKALAGGDALAAENFARGLNVVGDAQTLALEALAQSVRAAN